MRFDRDRHHFPTDPPDLSDPPEPVVPAARKGFWIGFAVSVAACLFVAFLGLALTGRLSVLGQSARRAQGAPPPPRIDLETARVRLRQAAAGAELLFPFPNPQILLLKEYGDLQLSYGERFVKRYRVKIAGNPPEGAYAFSGHALPQGAEPFTLTLEGCQPTSASAALLLHAGRAAAGQGRLTLIGGVTAPPAPPATPASATPAASAPEITLPESDLAELFAATAPGSLMLVVEK